MTKNNIVMPQPTGVLIVDKPQNYTSRDVVNKISKILGTKKVGHTGTLDPIATGVLIVTIGRCTKLGDFLTSTYKEYEATFILGHETDTLDTTGTVQKTSSKIVSEYEIIEATKSFQGEYLQEVPKYSAVKVDGKRLYEYARNGTEVELPKRKVEIKNIEILYIKENEVKIKCLVSKGTYIRSLIRDIGRKLGTYAVMSELRRTKQGTFTIENAYTLEDIENNNFRLLSVFQVLEDVPSYEVDESLAKMVENGCKLEINTTDPYIKFISHNEVLALYKKEENLYSMYVKF